MTETSLKQKFIRAYMEIKNPPLDGENPHFGNKFATLSSTLNEVRMVCIKNGIIYQQEFRIIDGEGFIITSISDENDRIILSNFPVVFNIDSQKFGSALTYAKRQVAQLDWGIVGEEDDDGNAQVPQNTQKTTQKPTKNDHYHIINELKKEANAVGISDDGIRDYISSKYVKPDGTPRAFTSLTISELKQVEEYIQILINDKKELING